MNTIKRHMNVIWKQQFSNCSYPRVSHICGSDGLIG